MEWKLVFTDVALTTDGGRKSNNWPLTPVLKTYEGNFRISRLERLITVLCEKTPLFQSLYPLEVFSSLEEDLMKIGLTED